MLEVLEVLVLVQVGAYVEETFNLVIAVQLQVRQEVLYHGFLS